MPLTNAERQKKYREKLKQNPEKHEKIKEQTRERMKKRKPIKELSEEEKKQRRQQWQMANERRRKKKNTEKSLIEGNIAEDTKSVSQGTAANINKITKDKKVIYLEREVRRQKSILEHVNKENKNLKKQVYRQKLKIKEVKESVAYHSNDIEAGSSNMTPLTKTNKFIEENIPQVSEKEKENVKRKVLELNVLSNSLQEEYNTAENNTKKEFLKRITSNEIVRKYKLKTRLTQCLGLKGQIRQKKEAKRACEESEKIKKFFKRDDNSRNTAGKKEYVLDKKIKKQKRFLLNSLRKLHEKYKAEGGKFSLSSFCRYRPRYIVRPKISDRDTCACIKHSNLSFKALKLKKLGVILTSDFENLVSSVACSIKAYDCMYGKCQKCKDRSPDFNNDSENESICNWLQWVRKEHVYSKRTANGTVKSVKTKKYVKEIACGTILDLKRLFLQDLLDFRKHYFNIIHQHTQYRNCIDNLNDDEICILIDFSENYQCKHFTEIQSAHFGASQQQITLHTGVLYAKSKKPKSFASLSACNDHDPGAIRAHLEPVIQYIKQEHSNTKIIHFFSDGPTTQYRQKKNFHLINQLITQHGFKFGTWSFSEAGHGKSAADGVGGTLKRILDQQVAFQKDVSHVVEAIDVLRENTKITLFHVTEAEIRRRQNEIPNDLIAVPKTMNVHQIIFRDGDLYFRDISCFCGLSKGLCTCFNVQKHDLHRIRRTSSEPTNLVSSNYIKPNKGSRAPLVQTLEKATKKLQKKKAPKKRESSSDDSSTTPENSDVPYAESEESLYSIDIEKSEDENFDNWSQPKINRKIQIISDILLNTDQYKNTRSESAGQVKRLLNETKLIRVSEQMKIPTPNRNLIKGKRNEKPGKESSPSDTQKITLPKSDPKIIPIKLYAADQVPLDNNDEQTMLESATSDHGINLDTHEECLSNEENGFDESSWVLIRYTTNYYYVAQVLSKSEFGTFKVLPMRKVSKNKYCPLDLNELDEVLGSRIVCSLSEPDYDRSGQYIFSNLPTLNYL